MTGKKTIQKKDIEKLSQILGENTGILFGGSSMPFYGTTRATIDIDFEVPNATLEQIVIIEDSLNISSIDGDITANANGWGMIPLPEGYQERAIQTEFKNIKVLNPLDFVLSKIRRGTEIDQDDCIAVCQAKNISGKEILEHVNLIKLPADPETILFLRRVDNLAKTVNHKKK